MSNYQAGNEAASNAVDFHRDAYNAALVSGKLKPDEVRATKFEIAKLNEIVVFNPRRFDTDAFGGSFTVPSGGVLAKIAKRFDVTPELLLRVNGMADARRLQAGKSIKVVKGPLHAVVDKSDFTLDVYFGAPGGPNSTYLTTFRVGLGKVRQFDRVVQITDSVESDRWVSVLPAGLRLESV